MFSTQSVKMSEEIPKIWIKLLKGGGGGQGQGRCHGFVFCSSLHAPHSQPISSPPVQLFTSLPSQQDQAGGVLALEVPSHKGLGGEQNPTWHWADSSGQQASMFLWGAKAPSHRGSSSPLPPLLILFLFCSSPMDRKHYIMLLWEMLLLLGYHQLTPCSIFRRMLRDRAVGEGSNSERRRERET